MTSTQFSGFWTPSPPCLHFGKIHKTKSTQPPLLRLHFVNPPSPPQCRRHLSMAPKGNNFCRWSIEPVPPCASICRPTQAPEAPYGTDLDLLGVIPIKDNQTVLNMQS